MPTVSLSRIRTLRLTLCWTADSIGVMPPWEKVESPIAATAGE